MIVLFGGSSDYELTRMEAYDPQKDRWITLPSPPQNIVKASITSCDDVIFISGLLKKKENRNVVKLNYIMFSLPSSKNPVVVAMWLESPPIS
mgnify:FL=1